MRRSLALLIIVSTRTVLTSAASRSDACGLSGPRASSGHQLLQHATNRLGVQNSPASYGSPGCPCIGLDRTSGTATSQGESSDSQAYPASVGAHCDAWDNRSCGQAKSTDPFCQAQTPMPWCFVDPCNCNVSSREHPAWQGLTWQGHPVYASAATCGSHSAEGKPSQPSLCKDPGRFLEELMGHANCKCIGIAGLSGNLSVNFSTESPFPADLGSSCQKWDEGRHPDCRGEDPPGWCHRQWCYVDPCSCSIEEPPKVSTYFPKATYGHKPLYYSYESCNSFDTFTFDSRSACVNQESEARCLALGGDPEDPEIRKCAWGGPEIKCLGKELLHVCQISDKTLSDWSWWSFNRGSVGDARTSKVTVGVTATLYLLLAMLFVCVVRGLM
ncbi:GST1 [Symbiodinium natans]|uniref:GST1 protein n=1 Tax=Symbiodinium natans TaxID=878477 RepID=A0A812NH99_9DINO|nr:GST1 [Symbiodinium natans]